MVSFCLDGPMGSMKNRRANFLGFCYYEDHFRTIDSCLFYNIGQIFSCTNERHKIFGDTGVGSFWRWLFLVP